MFGFGGGPDPDDGRPPRRGYRAPRDMAHRSHTVEDAKSEMTNHVKAAIRSHILGRKFTRLLIERFHEMYPLDVDTHDELMILLEDREAALNQQEVEREEEYRRLEQERRRNEEERAADRERELKEISYEAELLEGDVDNADQDVRGANYVAASMLQERLRRLGGNEGLERGLVHLGSIFSRPL